MSLQRTTPLRRRPNRKRRDGKPMCTARGCRRARFDQLVCILHAADRIFSEQVRARDEVCQAAAMFPEIVCRGDLQCMHLASRRYFSTRWDFRNAKAGCAAHHLWLTEHPLEHLDFCERVLGVQGWRAMRDVARHGDPERAEDAWARLSGRAA